MKNQKLILTSLVSILFLSGCSGSGSSSKTESPTISEAPIKVDISQIQIESEKLKDYKIEFDGETTEVSEPESISVDKNKKGVAALVNTSGTPILIGRKHKGDSNVEVSLESSAEMFVLFSPRFFGVESTDSKELSKRIRNHPKFPELVQSIKNEIDTGSTCPLNPKCNFRAAIITSKLVDTLEVNDLFSE